MPHRFVWKNLTWLAKAAADRFRRFLFYRVFSLNDTPHRIALGVAVGMFVAWTPTMPFQMVLTIAISALVGANKFVGVPFVWVTNPVTLIPIYGPNYILGSWLLGRESAIKQFISEMQSCMSFSGGFWETTKTWWQATLNFFAPLWLGSLLMGIVVAAVSYCLILWGVIKFRAVYHHLHDGHGTSDTKEQAPQQKQSSDPPAGSSSETSDVSS
jgi:hypothetical protein